MDGMRLGREPQRTGGWQARRGRPLDVPRWEARGRAAGRAQLHRQPGDDSIVPNMAGVVAAADGGRGGRGRPGDDAEQVEHSIPRDRAAVADSNVAAAGSVAAADNDAAAVDGHRGDTAESAEDRSHCHCHGARIAVDSSILLETGAGDSLQSRVRHGQLTRQRQRQQRRAASRLPELPEEAAAVDCLFWDPRRGRQSRRGAQRRRVARIACAGEAALLQLRGPPRLPPQTSQT